MGCHALLQEIFPTQGSNPGLPHCRQILDCLSYQGNPLQGWIQIKCKKEVSLLTKREEAYSGSLDFRTLIGLTFLEAGFSADGEASLSCCPTPANPPCVPCTRSGAQHQEIPVSSSYDTRLPKKLLFKCGFLPRTPYVPFPTLLPNP